MKKIVYTDTILYDLNYTVHIDINKQMNKKKLFM